MYIHIFAFLTTSIPQIFLHSLSWHFQCPSCTICYSVTYCSCTCLQCVRKKMTPNCWGGKRLHDFAANLLGNNVLNFIASLQKILRKIFWFLFFGHSVFATTIAEVCAVYILCQTECSLCLHWRYRHYEVTNSKVHTRFSSVNKSNWIETSTPRTEQSQFMVNYFFGNLI